MNLNNLSDVAIATARHRGVPPWELENQIERAAGISAHATQEEIAEYTTWQVQQLRRVMRCRRAMPWRDCQIMADELDEMTYHELANRGAWTLSWLDRQLGEYAPRAT